MRNRVRSENARNIKFTWVSGMAQYIRMRDFKARKILIPGISLDPTGKPTPTKRIRLSSSALWGPKQSVPPCCLQPSVVGSGIMAEQLSGGNVAIALLANTLATGAALVALILTFGAISGAHFNPAVTIADALEGGIAWRDTPYYVLAQVVGAIAGTIAAHLMFRLPILSLSQHVRSGPSQLFSEFVATFGLLSVIWGCSRLCSNTVAFAVGSYITAAYWFTASTSFANPAVTFARSFTDTFSGIRPSDAPGFMAAQFAGALAATFLFRWLAPGLKKSAADVVVSHGEPRKDF
jgi:glycerol uptake facilitator-like aquaporin